MKKKNFLVAFSAFAVAAFCGVASAQSSSSTTSNSQPANNPALFAGVFSGQALNNASNTGSIVSSIASGGLVIGGLDFKRMALTGTNAGKAAAAGATEVWNVWGAYSRSNIAFNYAPLQSSGSVDVFLGGVDYTFANNTVLGVALARDNTDVDLNFSGGKLKGKGITLSPYIGIPFNKNLAFDAMVGIGRTDIDTAVGNVFGSSRSDRNLGSVGLTYRETIDAWTLSARGSFLTVRDKLGAYTLTNGTFVPDGTVNVSQVRFTGMAAYSFDAVTPFASLSYINDISRPDQAAIGGVAAANDRDAWTPAVGFRFKIDKSVYGSFQYSSERSRQEVKNNNYTFNVGIRF